MHFLLHIDKKRIQSHFGDLKGGKKVHFFFF